MVVPIEDNLLNCLVDKFLAEKLKLEKIFGGHKIYIP
jgi:hypothetical protein